MSQTVFAAPRCAVELIAFAGQNIEHVNTAEAIPGRNKGRYFVTKLANNPGLGEFRYNQISLR